MKPASPPRKRARLEHGKLFAWRPGCHSAGARGVATQFIWIVAFLSIGKIFFIAIHEFNVLVFLSLRLSFSKKKKNIRHLFVLHAFSF